jgi:hypothetical protein
MYVIYYALRKDNGIFCPSATYFISADSERLSVHFNIGMYNKIHTNCIFPVFWDVRVRIFHQYLISMQDQIPPLNTTKFENFHLVIAFPVEGTIFQNLFVQTHKLL